MASNINDGLLLPAEANAVVWRIFGNFGSPFRKATPFKLVEKIICKRVAPAHKNQAIAVINSWFESQGDGSWLKEEMREPVAALILHGVNQAYSTPNGIEESDTAFWAVGSIVPETAIPIMHALFAQEDLASFVKYVIKTLGVLCDKDAVFDANRFTGIEGTKASLPSNALQCPKRLQTFLDQERYDHWLYPSVRNMVELLVRLNSQHFHALVSGIDHPLIQIHAARWMIYTSTPRSHHTPLQWITEKASDALVALAIVHVLYNINSLASEFRQNGESRPAQADVDKSINCLLSGLVDRLALFEPAACARWIVELLSHGIGELAAGSSFEKPRKVEQLEKVCTELLVHLVSQSWSDELLAELRAGLSLNLPVPRNLPLADVAWEIREEYPARAAEVARLLLDSHEQLIAKTLEGTDTLFYKLNYWGDREWVLGLGVALVLSREDIDLPAWVLERCRELPLTAWDAEENLESFRIAEKVAQFRFLVAFHAIGIQEKTGHLTQSKPIRALVEKLWAHCHFVGRISYITPEGSVVAEYGARLAVLLGEPSDVWLLHQARSPEVDPRTLFALIDQRLSKNAQAFRLDAFHEEMITAELLSIANSRFGHVRRMGLTTLLYLAKIWLLLGGVDEAEQTARAIIALQQPELNREHNIIALQLLAYAFSKRKLAEANRDEISSLYDQLWRGYTPSEEREKRQEIDDLLKEVL